ncbi:DNA polymerase III subunit gamma/tau [Deinococcus sp. SL84]|uniref:DNA polymerase III subunit gamma/tau n=1 Tax=Deinococcus sp. SL84 TaxID=2994663 RepID=UPI0022743B2C|nr:DNA polymerase III subunit gamma/tau [Deinococcus sp. SL84]MCY1702322.1 DNA polymerase III subunit gamma/tau [Deinococcus sp. SL84]
MSAIYQRARPIHWDEVVGQEHIKGVLKTALEQGRVGHAYLFSGPRGVGKTTTARLIAMTANCTGPQPKPCGECENCRAVRAGSHPDVLEIDAASNNSVEDVRELREKVGLAPMRGGKKIYILDEAHMMSRAAFNALLKTLEEPPEHVIFILATTEPEKIIPTILSRCQHYRFRRLTAEEIAGKLAGLAEGEGVSAEPEALGLIGRLADGAMRDGESLLERMLAAGTAVTRRSVEEALGLPPGEQMRALAGALAQGDAGPALSSAGELYRAGFAARTVVEGLVEALSQAIHAELGVLEGAEAQAARLDGADVPRLLRLQAALDEQEARFSRAADLLSLELALTHALLAADGGAGGSAGGGAAAARAAAPAASPAVSSDLAARLSRLERELAALRAGGGAVALAAPAPAGPAVDDFDPGQRRRTPAPVGARPAPQVAAPANGTWADVLGMVSMQTRAFLKPARMHAEAGYVSLSYDAKGSFHARQIMTKLDELTPLLERVFGPVTLELITADGSGGRKIPVGGGQAAAARTAPAAPTPPSGQDDLTPPEMARDEVVQAAQGSASPPAPTDPKPTAAAVDEFDPLARRAAPARREAPPQGRPAESAESAGPARAEIQEIQEPQTAPAAAAARLRPAPPPTPDDMAEAPLPGQAPPWQDDPAEEPPLPAGVAEHTPETLAETATRELYLGEPVTEEPAWEDFGPPSERAAAPAPSRLQPSGPQEAAPVAGGQPGEPSGVNPLPRPRRNARPRHSDRLPQPRPPVRRLAALLSAISAPTPCTRTFVAVLPARCAKLARTARRLRPPPRRTLARTSDWSAGTLDCAHAGSFLL